MAVSITGNIATDGAGANVRLFATLVQEGPFGLQTFAGEVLSARALSLEVFATALDDVALVRQGDDRSFAAAGSQPQAQPQVQPQPQAQPQAQPLVPPPSRTAAPAPRITHPESPRAPSAAAPPPPPNDLPTAPTPVARPVQHRDDVEVYPETGDLVSHFHFGECEVMSSDGERIRLRQEKDGRVREVALGMLRIEAPTTDPATGKRHFRLSRKH